MTAIIPRRGWLPESRSYTLDLLCKSSTSSRWVRLQAEIPECPSSERRFLSPDDFLVTWLDSHSFENAIRPLFRSSWNSPGSWVWRAVFLANLCTYALNFARRLLFVPEHDHLLAWLINIRLYVDDLFRPCWSGGRRFDVHLSRPIAWGVNPAGLNPANSIRPSLLMPPVMN